MKQKWVYITIGLLALALIGGAGYLGVHGNEAAAKEVQAPPTVPVTQGDVIQSVDAPSELTATQEINLQMGVSGRLEDLLVQPGDSVKKGQVLARIGDQVKYEGAVANAQMQVAQAQQTLNDLINNAPQASSQAQVDMLNAQQAYTDTLTAQQNLNDLTSSQAYQDAQYELEAAQAEVNQLRSNYKNLPGTNKTNPEKAQTYFAMRMAINRRDRAQQQVDLLGGEPSQIELDQAAAKTALTKAQLESAQIQQAQLKDGPDQLKLTQYQAALDAAKAQLAQAHSDLSHLELRAPYDGVILDVNAQPGDNVTDSTSIIRMYAPSSVIVSGTITEEDFPIVKHGQKASLYFDAQPNLVLDGTVDRVIADRQEGSQALYPVYIKLDQIPEGLAPGMTVDAQIIIASRKNVLVLPRALVRARADGTATVQVWVNDHIETRNIRVGLRGDQNIEILSGLSLGDQVVSQ